MAAVQIGAGLCSPGAHHAAERLPLREAPKGQGWVRKPDHVNANLDSILCRTFPSLPIQIQPMLASCPPTSGGVV